MLLSKFVVESSSFSVTYIWHTHIPATHTHTHAYLTIPATVPFCPTSRAQVGSVTSTTRTHTMNLRSNCSWPLTCRSNQRQSWWDGAWDGHNLSVWWCNASSRCNWFRRVSWSIGLEFLPCIFKSCNEHIFIWTSESSTDILVNSLQVRV